MKEVVLLLGSNLGDTEKNVMEAINEIENKIGKVTKKSKILKTLPVEYISSCFFCNIAVALDTEYSPMKLLNKLKGIEKKMGRIKDSSVLGEYRDRIIDIDIVIYDGIIFKSEKLEIPHYKHLFSREFSKELLKNIDYLKIN